MKLIIRADDVGYTKIHNAGTFEAVDNGLVTACDVMLDTPGTVEALELLHDRPWISTGWHTHFWGAPVLAPADVPTMYDSKTGHFRRDLARAEDVSYDECLAEMRAEMRRCVRILGRPLDVANAGDWDTPFQRAKKKVVEEYGIPCNVSYEVDFKRLFSTHEVVYSTAPKAPWADRKIYMTVSKRGGAVNTVFMTDSLGVQRGYDPLKMFTEDEAGLADLPEDATAVVVFHPGYVDYYVACEGDQSEQARRYLVTRPIEAHALCSDALKNWVKENGIELVNFRDALYGTCDYQNHLYAMGSALYRRGSVDQGALPKK